MAHANSVDYEPLTFFITSLFFLGSLSTLTVRSSCTAPANNNGSAVAARGEVKVERLDEKKKAVCGEVHHSI